jgi:hypothetical protein
VAWQNSISRKDSRNASKSLFHNPAACTIQTVPMATINNFAIWLQGYKAEVLHPNF